MDFLLQITLQRDTIDISGTGQLTVGKLPDGVSNSSLTWVPVRLYSPEDGGLTPPNFAPNEVSLLFRDCGCIISKCQPNLDFPLVSCDHMTHHGCGFKSSYSRWEIPLDGVYLDGQMLADSTIPGNGVNSTSVSALIDTVCHAA
jgi:hypothetical protein